jgi:hypothetical protein
MSVKLQPMDLEWQCCTSFQINLVAEHWDTIENSQSLFGGGVGTEMRDEAMVAGEMRQAPIRVLSTSIKS